MTIKPTLWEMIETLGGEFHLVPAEELEFHHASRNCDCEPWQDIEGNWIHMTLAMQAARRASRARRRVFLAEGSGIPGDE